MQLTSDLLPATDDDDRLTKQGGLKRSDLLPSKLLIDR